MSGDFRFVPDYASIDALLDDPDLDDVLLEVGEEVAETARGLALKGETGEGAASIHAEVHRGAPASAFASTYSPEDENEPIAYVSWDQEHYYMLFAEEGTERQAPTPAVRPALDATEI